jgi:DNA mismatch repair protein MutL
MSRIKVLPDLLVNKIAAGEVIERPASVVKELMENAIDAGASHITLNIEDGGKQLIRVSDDGMGMTAEELRLAITPHATSKIIREDDLYSIATLGFRGEALPSIGAISHMRIASRQKDDVAGAEIIVSAERIESASAAGCRAGTTIEVRDLFFNVPARRKFLKGNATEVGHINEQVARLALAHPDIGFEVTNNGRNTHRLTGGSGTRERIAALFGRELGDDLIAIERDDRGLRIDGYVAPPARSRATAAGQYVLLNGRFIRDKFIQHAVREAFRGLMEHQRHPVVFLFLTIDPTQVDVNVHPTKIEVRWQNSQLVHSQVLAALRDRLLRSDLTPALQAPGDRSLGDARGGGPQGDSPEADALRREAADFFKGLTPTSGGDAGYDSRSGYGGSGGASGGSGVPSRLGDAQPRDGLAVWDALYGRSGDRGDVGSGAGAGRFDAGAFGDADNEANVLAGTEAGGAPRALQVHNSYLVVETAEGIVIVDQHALHERIMYDTLSRKITEGPLESQRLLLPETLSATPRELGLLAENEELLKQLGIEAEPFGSDTIAVQAFPSILKDTDAAAFLRDLLDKLADKDTATPRAKR